MQFNTPLYKNLLGLIVVGLIALLVAFSLSKYRLFPVTVVEVSGDYWHVSQNKLVNIITPELSGGFFSVDLKSLRVILLKEVPWIGSVSVSRRWPGTVRINIEQKRPVAIWNNVALLEKNGHLFYPLTTTFPPWLPVFSGRKEDKEALLSMYQHMLEFNPPEQLEITNLSLSKQGDWLVTFNQKTVVMLGDEDILRNFKHFIAIYSQFFVKKNKIAVYVDMRYSHGLAVKWSDK